MWYILQEVNALTKKDNPKNQCRITVKAINFLDDTHHAKQRLYHMHAGQAIQCEGKR